MFGKIHSPFFMKEELIGQDKDAHSHHLHLNYSENAGVIRRIMRWTPSSLPLCTCPKGSLPLESGRDCEYDGFQCRGLVTLCDEGTRILQLYLSPK